MDHSDGAVRKRLGVEPRGLVCVTVKSKTNRILAGHLRSPINEAHRADEEGDLCLFDSGAIVLHISERHAGLLPADINTRARAITWMFAALNTVELPILDFDNAKLLEGDKPWYTERRPLVENRLRDRPAKLSARLGDTEWIDGAFSAGVRSHGKSPNPGRKVLTREGIKSDTGRSHHKVFESPMAVRRRE